MLVCVLRAMSSGDDVPDAAELKLGVVAWVPGRDPLRKLLRPEITDDGSEECTDNGEDNVPGTVLRLVVVARVPSPDPVGTSLRLGNMDDGSERTDERVERGDDDSTSNGWFGKYSVTSYSKSRGGI
jgi:hypothetical protein